MELTKIAQIRFGIYEDEATREIIISPRLDKEARKIAEDMELEENEVNMEWVISFLRDETEAIIHDIKVERSWVNREETVALAIIRANLYAIKLDLSEFYKATERIKGKVLELARFLCYYYNVGRVILASSPDEGIYYKVVGGNSTAEIVKNYILEQQYIPRLVLIDEGYEVALVDISATIPDVRISHVKAWKVGNSHVVAIPRREGYYERVELSEDMVLYLRT